MEYLAAIQNDAVIVIHFINMEKMFMVLKSIENNPIYVYVYMLQKKFKIHFRISIVVISIWRKNRLFFFIHFYNCFDQYACVYFYIMKKIRNTFV